MPEPSILGTLTQRKPPVTSKYGPRADGTMKGEGFLGALPRLDDPSMISSELSATVRLNGKETLIPLMVPTLNRKELETLLSTQGVKNVPESVWAKAIDHAKSRLKAGKSIFAEPGESYPVPRE